MKCTWIAIALLNMLSNISGHPRAVWDDRDIMHPYHIETVDRSSYTEESDEPMHGFIKGDKVRTNWLKQGQVELKAALNEGLKMGVAKNIIFFVGDGMGMSTITMARIFKAQQRNLTGYDALLSWESFPHVALSRTYSTTTQVADSAATGTALMSGEKTSHGTVGVNQNVPKGNCSAVKGNEVKSAVNYAIDEGKWTGIISTTQITHATPAAAYAHVADRTWESDADLIKDNATECKDIAAQLIDSDYGRKIKVLLSGGRKNFYSKNESDVEYPDQMGTRLDGRDLVQDWIDDKINDQGINADKVKYVHDQTGFDAVDSKSVEYLMGLFEPSYMEYEAFRQKNGMKEPSLTEMVEKSIDILSRNTEQGYFLFVEGGRIDHAHHETNTYNALADTLALQDAVQKAVEKTNVEDTLIIVTADHSHAFTMAGYADISEDILGFADIAEDGKPYTTASYANGPGFVDHRVDNNNQTIPRIDLTNIDTSDMNFRQDAGIYAESETHGGEDVPVYARGPMSHLFHGAHEGSYVAHVMMYASCIGENKEHCEKPWSYPGCPPATSLSTGISFKISCVISIVILHISTVIL